MQQRKQKNDVNKFRTRSEIEQLLRGAGVHPGMWARAANLPLVGANNRSQVTEDGGFDWILTTEKPTVVWDWKRWDFVNEILLADGMLVPANNQVVLLDSHNRNSVKDVLGHVRDFTETKTGDFLARSASVFFADDPDSVNARTKVEGNHITDGSVGYKQLGSVWVDEGEEVSVKGKIFEGPVRVTYEWLLMEFSITPIGADVLAKVRELKELCGV